MNLKRLLLAIVAVFAAIWISDFLIHGVWLRADYEASKSLWRPKPEMQARIGWLFAGELLASVIFVVLYARGFAAMNCLRCACFYGAGMGLFSAAATLINYTVLPLPGSLAVKWVAAAVAQGLFAGLIVYFAYRLPPEHAAIKRGI